MAFSGVLPKVVPDVGPGGGVITAMRGVNALGQDRLNQLQTQAQTQLAQQQAQMLPYQIALQSITGPQSAMLWAQHPDIATNILNKTLQMPQQMASQIGNNNSINNPFSGSPLGWIINKLSGGGQISTPENPMSVANSQMGNGNAVSPSNLSNAANGTSDNLGSSNISSSGATSIPIGNIPDPNTNAYFGAQAGVSEAKGTGKNFADQWKDRFDDMKDQSQSAINSNTLLNNLEDSYGKLGNIEEGPFFGKVPAISSNAQNTDIAAKNLQVQRAKLIQNGANKITNMDLQLGGQTKLGRYMNPEAFHDELNYERAMNSRILEYQPFMVQAQKFGLSPAQADAVWSRYANERPPFDPKSRQAIKNNLNTWGDYLTPQAINQTFSPGYQPTLKKYQNNMLGNKSASQNVNTNLGSDSNIGITKFNDQKRVPMQIFKNGRMVNITAKAADVSKIQKISDQEEAKWRAQNG